MVDSQPVDQAFFDEFQDLAVGFLEHLGILDADAGEVVDGEEPPVPPSLGVGVEELVPALEVAPVRVLLARGHVIGHEVDDHAHPGVTGGLNEPAKRLLAAELSGHARRVDDVIAVGRSRARLHDRGEVEVADSQRAQIADERAGVIEAEASRELKAVGGAHALPRTLADRFPFSCRAGRGVDQSSSSIDGFFSAPRRGPGRSISNHTCVVPS